MKKYKTELSIVCAWCKKPMGTKDGKGVSGTTSAICPDCAKKEWAKVPGGKPPARWNLVGRFLYRRRQRLARRRRGEHLADLEDQEVKESEDNKFLADMFIKNPDLHARIMLQGERHVHYMTDEDLATVEGNLAGEPEYRCRMN